MSTTQSGVVVVCDDCGRRLATACTTSPGARGDAERKGWRVSYLAGGAHPTKRSGTPTDRDQCPSCRPQPQPEGLLAESDEGDPK